MYYLVEMRGRHRAAASLNALSAAAGAMHPAIKAWNVRPVLVVKGACWLMDIQPAGFCARRQHLPASVESGGDPPAGAGCLRGVSMKPACTYTDRQVIRLF